MRLYTIQHPHVIVECMRRKKYVAKWGTIMEPDWRFAYEWMIKEYNRINKTEYTLPFVFYYTDIKHALSAFKRECFFNGGCLIKCDVPDDLVLLHDFDLWHSVLGNYQIDGNSFNERILSDKLWDEHWELFHKRADLLTQASKEETWKHVFKLTKRDKYKTTVHAVTPYLKSEWII